MSNVFSGQRGLTVLSCPSQILDFSVDLYDKETLENLEKYIDPSKVRQLSGSSSRIGTQISPSLRLNTCFHSLLGFQICKNESHSPSPSHHHCYHIKTV